MNSPKEKQLVERSRGGNKGITKNKNVNSRFEYDNYSMRE